MGLKVAAPSSGRPVVTFQLPSQTADCSAFKCNDNNKKSAPIIKPNNGSLRNRASGGRNRSKVSNK